MIDADADDDFEGSVADSIHDTCKTLTMTATMAKLRPGVLDYLVKKLRAAASDLEAELQRRGVTPHCEHD